MPSTLVTNSGACSGTQFKACASSISITLMPLRAAFPSSRASWKVKLRICGQTIVVMLFPFSSRPWAAMLISVPKGAKSTTHGQTTLTWTWPQFSQNAMRIRNSYLWQPRKVSWHALRWARSPRRVRFLLRTHPPKWWLLLSSPAAVWMFLSSQHLLSSFWTRAMKISLCKSSTAYAKYSIRSKWKRSSMLSQLCSTSWR